MAGTLVSRPSRGAAPNAGWGTLGTLRQEFDDMVGRLWGADEPSLAIFAHVPAVDVSETAGEVTVKMDLPGMVADDIEIQLDANVLTVSGERREQKEEKGRTFHRVERRTGKFSRSMALPCSVEEDEVAAEYRDGTLTVALPKSEAAKARRIAVKT